MELFDIYDQERRLTGRAAERGTKLSVGDFRLVVNLSILNSDNQLLIQKRQPFKEGWPNMWDTQPVGVLLLAKQVKKRLRVRHKKRLGCSMIFLR